MVERPPIPVLMTDPLDPGLYVVATPIGNLRDITLRGLDILSRVELVLAEDTRVAGRLLAAYGIKAKLLRYDDHAAEAARPRVLQMLAVGGKVALVSDAGTPLVSDPGFRLVREVGQLGLPVFAAPGASAPLAALAVAGLPTDRFLFAGFPPPKTAGRKALFKELAPIRATLVFFEGGPRLGASLKDMAEVFGPREAAVARELTKLFEQCIRGPLDALAEDPRLQSPKGEIVVLVGPGDAAEASDTDVEAALLAALERAGPAEAASEVAKALGRPRRALYQMALALKGVSPEGDD